MGLPPTSPRFKFMYTHPVSASSNFAVPRRPPRQPPSPSTRSRSLELLDQQDQERKSVSSAIVQRPPLPRPRSRSLDGLLDEDAKNGEEQDKVQCDESRECPSTSSEEDRVIPALEENRKEFNAQTVESKDEPRPVPRTKPKMPDVIEFKSEIEDMRTSLNKDENDKETPTRPPKPSRRSSSEEQSSTCSNRQCADQEHLLEEQRIKKTAQERLTQNDDYDDNDKSTMLLKASRSCGAGLDSDGSVSSNEYSGHRARAKKGPGSLLSLPAGAEPKRKRNFMDKCVNKVRAFMKK